MDVQLSALKAHPQNYNQHSEAQIGRLMASLEKFGQPKEIVVWRGLIIAGHGLVEAALRLGWETLQASDVSEEWTEEQALAFMAADNELARLGDPDEAALAALAASVAEVDRELAALAAGTDERLKELLKTLESPAGDDPGAQVDKAEELRVKWDVQPGQLWALGEHRLICGDCTDREVVARVMGGERAQALVTDPPYAILGGGTSTAGKGIEAAFDRQFFRAWFSALLGVLDDHLSHDAAQWMTIDWRGATAIEEALVGKRWRLAALGVWNRGGLGMGYALRKTYENFALLVAQDWKRIKADEPDVWSFQWTPGNRQQGHAAEKPVELLQRAIEVCSTGEIVIDTFLGSGTTLIAAQNLNRQCRGVEISPGYVAVCLERWSVMTGRTPVLLEGDASAVLSMTGADGDQ